MAGKAKDLSLALLLPFFFTGVITPPKSSSRSPDCSPVQPSFLCLPVSGHLQEPVLLRRLLLSLLQNTARWPSPLFHRDRPSFPPRGPGTVATSEFPSCCLPQPKEGRAETRLYLSSSPSVILQSWETRGSTHRRGAAGAGASLCSSLLERRLRNAETPWECITDETLGFGFLAVSEFLTGTRYLWDLAKDHRSPKGAAPITPAEVSQPRCLSQLLCAAQFWFFCCHKPSRAQAFFLPFPVRKGPQPNKPFPARMVQTHRAQFLGCPFLSVTGDTAREGLNLPAFKPRGRRLPAQLPGSDRYRSAIHLSPASKWGRGPRHKPALEGTACRGAGAALRPRGPRRARRLRSRGPGLLRDRTHAPGTQTLIARHPREHGAALEPWQEAPAANPLHTSAGCGAKAAAARRHPMPALLAELPDSTKASP